MGVSLQGKLLSQGLGARTALAVGRWAFQRMRNRFGRVLFLHRLLADLPRSSPRSGALITLQHPLLKFLWIDRRQQVRALHRLVYLRYAQGRFVNAGRVSSSEDVNTLAARGIHPSRAQIQFKCDFRRHSRGSYGKNHPEGHARDGCLKLQKIFDGPLLCGILRVLG